jgi:hypothetical protein
MQPRPSYDSGAQVTLRPCLEPCRPYPPPPTRSYLLHCSNTPSTDVKDIKYVINYDFPNNCEDYIHRIGRTGRAGNTGVSYTYFTADNSKQARELVGILRESKAEM